MTDKNKGEKPQDISDVTVPSTSRTDEQGRWVPPTPRSLGDLRTEMGLVRDSVKIEELVGVEIVVTGLREWKGQYGPCATIHIVRDGEPLYCVTSATVIRQKLEEVRAHFPLTCTIIREERYYDVV